MNSYSTLKRLAAYGLSILLLASPSFVTAQEAPESRPFEPVPASAFELGVADLVDATKLLAGNRGPKVEAVVADMMLVERNAWRDVSADDSMQDQQATPKKGGFGRWLKKRWYIPVLVAVVVGVAAADDSDAGELDDD